MGGIHEVRRWDGLRCHDTCIRVHTTFHKVWFIHSKLMGGIHGQHRARISLLSCFQNKESRLRRTKFRRGAGLRAGRPRGRSSSPSRRKIFLFLTLFVPVLGPTQTPIQWVLRALSLGVKRQEHEADHPPPTSAEVKNTWIYTSTSLCLHGVVLN
jgi:hypothetical protein